MNEEAGGGRFRNSLNVFLALSLRGTIISNSLVDSFFLGGEVRLSIIMSDFCLVGEVTLSGVGCLEIIYRGEYTGLKFGVSKL